MGVGSDQAYILIGWQRPEYAWLVDYDPVVKLIHELHAALFVAAETPKEFFRMYMPENTEEALAAIDARYDGERAKEIKARFLKHRRMIRLRLWHVRARLKEVKSATYLTDQDTYDFVRAMVLEGRMRPMVADLTGTEAITGIAEAAMELEVPIRVMYLSNAEQYWKEYPATFRENVLKLPIDSSSILLRTKVFRWINDYTYIVQELENYRAWLCGEGVVNVNDVYGKLDKPDPDKLNKVYVTRDPPAPPPP
jgi:nitrogenase molybdenum-iron protein alpha/beta subunit